MIRRPHVILLDEATSALDNACERSVQGALDEFASRGSAIVVAHRLSTIQDEDKICVIDKGVVVKEGTHDELLAKHRDRALSSVTNNATGANNSGDGDTDAASTGSGSPKSKSPLTRDVDGNVLGPPPPLAEKPSLLCNRRKGGDCNKENENTHAVLDSGCNGGKVNSVLKPVGVRSVSDSGTLTPDAPTRRKRRAVVFASAAKLTIKGISANIFLPENTTSYARLWHSAAGDHEMKSLAQIGKKIKEIESELEQLRSREAKMLWVKSRLLEPINYD